MTSKLSSSPGHDLLPVPALISWQSGELMLTSGFSARQEGDDPRVQAALEGLHRRLEGLGPSSRTEGKAPVLSVEWARPGAAVQSVEEDESYRLRVTPQGARLQATTPLGVL